MPEIIGEALLIGVQIYENDEVFEPLSADIDVNKMDVALASHYKIKKVLNPEDTSTDAIWRALEKFLDTESAGNKPAILYFSGHGYQKRADGRYDPPVGYLATSDCRVTVSDDKSLVTGQTAPGINLKDLNTLIHKSHRQSVTLLIDACHSGHAAIEAGLLQSSFSRGSLRNFHVIAACQSGELAKSNEQKGAADQGGVFTRFLAEGLSKTAGSRNFDGQITTATLFEYLYKKFWQGDGARVAQQPIHANHADAPIVLKQYDVLAPDNPLVVKPPEPIYVDSEKTKILHPYPGLEAFEEQHAELFFGRKDVIEAIRQKLKKAALVPIIGASGSGKSSVVRAGLVPLLKNETQGGKQGTEGSWRILEPIKPDRYALEELKRVLIDGVFKDYLNETDLRDLRYSKTIIEDLTEAIARIPNVLNQYLLFIDQFEELFTLNSLVASEENLQSSGSLSQSEQAKFIEILIAIAQLPHTPIKIVFTMRADFIGHCLQYESLHSQIQGNCAVFMPPMRQVDFQRAIREPAIRQSGKQDVVEQALLDTLLDDAESEPGSLPLLQFALKLLWNRRDQKTGRMTLEDYKNLGKPQDSAEEQAAAVNSSDGRNGLQRALNVYANWVYDHKLDPSGRPSRKRTAEEQRWIQQIFVNLVRTREGSTDTRKRLSEASLLSIVKDLHSEKYSAFRELLDDLVDSRLLVQGDADPTTFEALLKHPPSQLVRNALTNSVETAEVTKIIDLAHEALISGWQRFAGWLDENRDVRRVADQMDDQRRRWSQVEADEKHKYLMMGVLLEQVREYWKAGKIQPYLLDSDDERSHKTDAATFFRESDRREKTEKETLRRALTEAEVQFKASQANNRLADGRSLEALTLSIQALNQNWENLPHKLFGPVQQALFNAVNSGYSSHCVSGHADVVYSVAISADGGTIVSGSGDGTVRLWDLADGILLRTLEGHTDTVYSVAISADGSTIVSGSKDGSVRVWDLADGILLRTLEGHTDAVWSVVISADGGIIASGSLDSSVRVWNLADGSLLRTLRHYTGGIASVAITADGSTIVSGGTDGTVQVWGVADGSILHTLESHTDCIYSVAVSFDTNTIVSGSSDHTVRVWNLTNGDLLHVLEGHTDQVRSVAISADGSAIVSGSKDGSMRAWNLADGSLLHTSRHDVGGIVSVAITADGSTIVSGGEDCSVRIWSLDGGTPLHTFEGHAATFWSAALGADGNTIVSGSGDGSVRVWDLANGALLRTLKGHTDAVFSVAISTDGTTVVSGSGDGSVRVWNLADGALLHILEGHTGTIFSVAISADGSTIVSGSADSTIRVWNLVDGTLLRVLEGHTDTVRSVAISADGSTIVSGSHDNSVRVWNLADGTLSRIVGHHTNNVISVAISASGSTIVSGGFDRRIGVWNLSDGTLLRTLEGHANTVYSVAVSADEDTIVSGSHDNSVRVWNLADGILLRTLEGHTAGVQTVAISTDGDTIVSAGTDSSMRVWNLANSILSDVLEGHTNDVLEGHTNTVYSVAVSANGSTIISGSHDNSVRVWNLADGTLLHLLEGHTAAVRAVAISADSSIIVSGSADSSVRVWNLTNGTLLRTLEGHTDTIWSLALSTDGSTLVSGSADKSVRVWNLADGALLHVLEDHTDLVCSVTISADGSTLVSGSRDDKVRVWNLLDGTLLRVLEGHTNVIFSVAASADGNLIVSGSGDNSVRVWNRIDGTLLHTLEGHTDMVRSVAISADGSMIVSGSGDNSVRVWNRIDGTLLHTLEGHTGSVNSVDITADGSTIVSGSGDGSVRVWKGCGWQSWLKIGLAKLGTRWQHDPGAVVSRARLFQKAERVLATGNIDGAIQVFKQALTCGSPTLLTKYGVPTDPADIAALAKAKAAPGLVRQAENIFHSIEMPLNDTTYSNTLKLLKQAKEFDDSLELDPEARAGQLMAIRLQQRGNFLIFQGNLADGIAALAEAHEYDFTIPLVTVEEAQQRYALVLVDQGKWLAFTAIRTVPSIQDAMVRLESAKAKLELAKQYYPNLDINPEQEINHIEPSILMEVSKRWVLEQRVDNALEAYNRAQSLNPEIKFTTKELYIFCLMGSLYATKQRQPKLVKAILAASESTLEAEPNNALNRGVLAFSRILAGGKRRWQAAVTDLQFLLETWHGSKKEKEETQDILERLEAALKETSRTRYDKLLTEAEIDKMIRDLDDLQAAA